MCEDARALARINGACEMLRRRNNLNRTFAGAKPDTSHFAFFEVQNWTFRISHISQVRNRTLRSFAGCETGHSTVSHPDTTPPA